MIIVLLWPEAEALKNRFSKSPYVENKADLECRGQYPFDLLNFVGGEAFVFDGFRIDKRSSVQGSLSFCVIDDVPDFVFCIAQVSQGNRNGLIDDFEITSTGQFLEFYQSKIRLNASGITIHNQADGSGWGQYSCLGVAITTFLPEAKRVIPSITGRL